MRARYDAVNLRLLFCRVHIVPIIACIAHSENVVIYYVAMSSSYYVAVVILVSLV